MSDENNFDIIFNRENIILISANCYRLIIGLLSNLKQNGYKYKHFHKYITVLISSLEEICKFYITNIQKKDKMEENNTKIISFLYNFHENILSFIFLYFQEESITNSLSDIYLSFISLYFEEIIKEKIYFFNKHKSLIEKTIEELVTRKIEYVNGINDSKNILYTFKILKILLEITDGISETNLKLYFDFIFKSIQLLFTLSELVFLEEFFELAYKVVEFIFKNIKIEEIFLFIDSIEILIDKIQYIASLKDSLKEGEYSTQILYFSNLTFCLKSFNYIVKLNLFKNKELYEGLSIKITKSIVYLSFWDNSVIIDLTSQIIEKLWIQTLYLNIPILKFDYELIFDYFFNKRLKEYYDILSNISFDNNKYEIEIDVKLSVLELIITYLNNLIIEEDFFFIWLYSSDIIQLNHGVAFELFSNLIKFYSLNLPHYEYIKSIIGNIISKLTNYIFKFCINKDFKSNIFIENYKSYLNNIAFWEGVINKINLGKFKNLFSYLQENFGIINTTKVKKKKNNDSLQLEIEINKNIDNKIENEIISLQKSQSISQSIDSNDEKVVTLNDIVSRNREIAKLIAIILRYSSNIDVNIIYEIIGMNDDFSNLILQEYLKTFSFLGIDIICAYRIFISTFKLGGESYVLYNIILEFSKKYFEDNKGECVFENEDEVSTFAYSLLMLNTDLHDPNIKEHMKVEEFIKNNRITGYYKGIKDEFFKEIYKNIHQNPLKIAKSRQTEYSKSEEIFHLIINKRKYFYDNIDLANKSYLEFITNKEQEIYPFIFLSGNLIYNEDENIILLYHFFDKITKSILEISPNFYISNVENIIINLCETAILQNKNDLIKCILDKITAILQFEKPGYNKETLFNLYFHISINYIEKLSSYMEFFFNNILDLFRLNINEEVFCILPSKFILDSNEIIGRIIESSFSIIFKKKFYKKESYFGFIFGSSNNEDDYAKGFEQFKSYIIKLLKINSNNKIERREDQYLTEPLCSFKKIINKIRKNTEEFPFLLNLAFMRIIEYKDISEMCLSILFLNEILKEELTEIEFSKIWHNLLNILHSKMELNTNFGEKENNVFEVMLINDFVTTAISKYINCINSQDYYSFLEKYIEIDNTEIIYYILENNNKIVNTINSLNIIKKEQILDCLIYFFDKYISQINNIQNVGNSLIQMEFSKNQNVLIFLNNLIQNIPSATYFSSDSINFIIKIFKNLKDKKYIDKQYIINLIRTLSSKLMSLEINLIDEKSDLFINIFNFTLEGILNENKNIQNDYLLLINEILMDKKIPLLKIKEITSNLNKFYNSVIYLKTKSESFWERIFLLFFNIIKSNKDLLFDCPEMEQLWNCFIRKYLISYVDYKRINNILENENNGDVALKEIISYLKCHCKYISLNIYILIFSF